MYVVSEENYLEHYGRKGMRWGEHIFGDEKTRTARYRDKQLTKTNKKYDKAISRAKKLNNYGITDYARKKNTEISKAQLRLLKAQQKIETDYIKNMTWDDVKGERAAVGKEFAKDMVLSAATLPLALVGLPSAVILPRPSAIKTNYRFKQIDKKKRQ